MDSPKGKASMMHQHNIHVNLDIIISRKLCCDFEEVQRLIKEISV